MSNPMLDADEKKRVLHRLRRVSGQVDAIGRMIESEGERSSGERKQKSILGGSTFLINLIMGLDKTLFMAFKFIALFRVKAPARTFG